MRRDGPGSVSAEVLHGVLPLVAQLKTLTGCDGAVELARWVAEHAAILEGGPRRSDASTGSRPHSRPSQDVPFSPTDLQRRASLAAIRQRHSVQLHPDRMAFSEVNLEHQGIRRGRHGSEACIEAAKAALHFPGPTNFVEIDWGHKKMNSVPVSPEEETNADFPAGKGGAEIVAPEPGGAESAAAASDGAAGDGSPGAAVMVQQDIMGQSPRTGAADASRPSCATDVEDKFALSISISGSGRVDGPMSVKAKSESPFSTLDSDAKQLLNVEQETKSVCSTPSRRAKLKSATLTPVAPRRPDSAMSARPGSAMSTRGSPDSHLQIMISPQPGLQRILVREWPPQGASLAVQKNPTGPGSLKSKLNSMLTKALRQGAASSAQSLKDQQLSGSPCSGLEATVRPPLPSRSDRGQPSPRRTPRSALGPGPLDGSMTFGAMELSVIDELGDSTPTGNLMHPSPCHPQFVPQGDILQAVHDFDQSRHALPRSGTGTSNLSTVSSMTKSNTALNPLIAPRPGAVHNTSARTLKNAVSFVTFMRAPLGHTEEDPNEAEEHEASRSIKSDMSGWGEGGWSPDASMQGSPPGELKRVDSLLGLQAPGAEEQAGPPPAKRKATFGGVWSEAATPQLVGVVDQSFKEEMGRRRRSMVEITEEESELDVMSPRPRRISGSLHASSKSLICTVPLTEAQEEAEETQDFFSWFDRYWTAVLFTYTLYQLIAIPARCGLRSTMSWAAVSVDLVLDLIIYAEIALRCYRPYDNRGVCVCDRAAVWAHYRSTTLLWDTVSCCPVDLVALIVHAAVGSAPSAVAWFPWYRVNKLMLGRYARGQFLEFLSRIFLGSPMVVRAIQTMWVFCLACHFTGCGYLIVLGTESREDVVAFVAVEEMTDGTDFQRYALLYDYSLKALVGMGRPGKIVPHTDVQVAFSIFIALAGVCFYALLLATIANIVSQQVSNKEEWRERRDAIHDLLSYLGRTHTIPDAFRDEMHAYFHHEFWVSRLMLGKPQDVFGVLPDRISRKVNLAVGESIFSRIPMFASAAQDAEFVNFMVSRLIPTTYCKGEVVVTKGDEGDFMFFLMEGEVGIFDEVQKRIVFVLNRGAALGEIALLQDCRRTATVVAVEFCSCFILKRESFLEAENVFPDVIAHVRQEGESRLSQMKITNLFSKLPILQPYQNDPAVVSVMMDGVKPEIYPPGATILSKSELSEHLYFISQGTVRYGKYKLTVGDYFGAISCGLKFREVANVSSVNHVTLFALAKDDVWKLAPGLVQKVQLTAYAQFVDYLMNDLFHPHLPYFKGGSLSDASPSVACIGSARKASMPFMTPYARLKERESMWDPSETEVTAGTPMGAFQDGERLGEFFGSLAVVLTEVQVPAGTCVVVPGHPVQGMMFISEGMLVEAYGDSLNYLRMPKDHFGSKCVTKTDGYVADTSLVAAVDSVVYMLSSADMAELAASFPDQAQGFLLLFQREMILTFARKLFSVTTVGTMKRLFLRWLCFARLQQDQRRYKFLGTTAGMSPSVIIHG
eukprot:TRINITY_DN2205_c0_g3_i1.p1 TRINITY_DN2205_c0_g3~~TRINITY_DN2205_c0_g3_i1.p1  ORF type:complete len:1516 (+),score=337.88 TRINITY_DN2205_c0_g3_i1:41-4588(+)